MLPSLGCQAVNSQKLRAVKIETAAAIIIETVNAEPA
jgi:hypothetical protein